MPGGDHLDERGGWIGFGWEGLVSGEEGLVSAGFRVGRTGFGWFQGGKDWFRLVSCGKDWFRVVSAHPLFDSRTMRSIVCECMLSDTVAMENQTALRAAWLCGWAWFLETRLKQQFRFQLDLPDDFRSTFEKKHVMTEK